MIISQFHPFRSFLYFFFFFAIIFLLLMIIIRDDDKINDFITRFCWWVEVGLERLPWGPLFLLTILVLLFFSLFFKKINNNYYNICLLINHSARDTMRLGATSMIYLFFFLFSSFFLFFASLFHYTFIPITINNNHHVISWCWALSCSFLG